mmetsp:Transcript_20985/g.42569  ORF Transcript_20985/g.42569 Transcript_20985/m.42569 type:complete len:88 (+) Transcript_20985:432-695(+)
MILARPGSIKEYPSMIIQKTLIRKFELLVVDWKSNRQYSLDISLPSPSPSPSQANESTSRGRPGPPSSLLSAAFCFESHVSLAVSID